MTDNFYAGIRGAWWRVFLGRLACWMADEHVDKWNNGNPACVRCGRWKYGE